MNRRAILSISVAALVAMTAAPSFAQGKDPARLRVALLPDENALPSEAKSTLIPPLQTKPEWLVTLRHR